MRDRIAPDDRNAPSPSLGAFRVCFACRMGLPWPCRCQHKVSGGKRARITKTDLVVGTWLAGTCFLAAGLPFVLIALTALDSGICLVIGVGAFLASALVGALCLGAGTPLETGAGL